MTGSTTAASGSSQVVRHSLPSLFFFFSPLSSAGFRHAQRPHINVPLCQQGLSNIIYFQRTTLPSFFLLLLFPRDKNRSYGMVVTWRDAPPFSSQFFLLLSFLSLPLLPVIFAALGVPIITARDLEESTAKKVLARLSFPLYLFFLPPSFLFYGSNT